MQRSPPNFSSVTAAAARLDGVAHRTPVLTSSSLNKRYGAEFFFKCENFQRMGAFKFRGGYNALVSIPVAERAAGVVAYSSGNHAQAIALSSQMLAMPAVIVMPEDAPAIKLERTRAMGAQVVTYRRGVEDRDQIALAIQEKTGGQFVHPYNNPAVVAGQGTIGLEIAEQAEAMGLVPDVAVACTGGGGLSSGVALALSHKVPGIDFRTAEPVGFDDFSRSLLSGHIESNASASGSICDAILTPEPGLLAFSILKEIAGPGLVVSDRDALDAVAFAFRELKLVLEPGGAVALAAVLSGKLDIRGRIAAIVLTGGNVDPQTLQTALA